MRWVWRYEDYVARENFGRGVTVAPAILPLGTAQVGPACSATTELLHRELATGGRANSKRSTAAKRIVIPPPIEVNRFHMSNDIEDYYLILSRLMPYKRIDLAIEACKRMNRRLVIIGDGPDRARLEKLADDESNFSDANRIRS